VIRPALVGRHGLGSRVLIDDLPAARVHKRGAEALGVEHPFSVRRSEPEDARHDPQARISARNDLVEGPAVARIGKRPFRPALSAANRTLDQPRGSRMPKVVL